MKLNRYTTERANGIVVVVSVVTTILVMLGAAVSYTAHVSRLAQRARKTALAVEIADGHLEYLFTNWRNTYQKTWVAYSGFATGGTDYSILPTNYFFTSLYNPGPAPSAIPYMTPAATPQPISTPSKSYFQTEPNYNVTQYRIQAVDPMIQLDPRPGSTFENALQESAFGSCADTVINCVTSGKLIPLPAASPPPPAYGPNAWQYSFYYLASVDVSVPAIGANNGGTVTAKVRRVFEKKFDNPWTYAMFYNDDLELQPTSSFTINGPIHTNTNLYIGNSNLTAQSSVGYGGSYMNGYSPNDTSSHSTGISAPNFQGTPPMQEASFLPFGWNLNLNSSDSSQNNDSYHEIIERPASGTDPLANVRYYGQPGYRIVLNDPNNAGATTVQRVDSSGNVTNITGSLYNTFVGNNGQGSSTTILQQNMPLYDAREGSAVKVTNFDVGKLLTAINNNTNNITKTSGVNYWTGLLYIADGSAGTSASVTINGASYSTTRRAIRLINGSTLPSPSGYDSQHPILSGLTVVSENPVYIQGDYNTGGTGSTVPSNAGTYTDPDASSYTRKPAAVVGDAINILSGGWNDTNSAQGIGSRVASANTTVNAALVGGIVPSSGGNYSGGGENFIRFLEDWSNRTFCYYGSMVELFNSKTANGPWNGNGAVFKSASTSRMYYDDATFSNISGPPGALQIAAYLQQQRWYQVY